LQEETKPISKGGQEVKIIRFEWEKTTRYGVVDGDSVFLLKGDLLGDFGKGKKLCNLGDVRPLAPVQPNIVVGIGGNYHSLLKVDTSIHSKPEAFLKPPSSVIGHLDNIVYPKMVNAVHMEGELAVVMKREARRVPEEKALEYVLGYTCANDVTAHIEGERPGARIKSFYTFCPIGPCIVTDLDPSKLKITSRLNRVLVQDNDPTSDMVFSVSKIISYVTEFMALRPFDVILTGTSRPPAQLKVGDITEVEIEGIGILRNPVSQ
jgi:2-keto-4-pentenoate hydratase/2-oxohepta-3-ene-1,7-dioic acid hydratase in catechol pathway